MNRRLFLQTSAGALVFLLQERKAPADGVLFFGQSPPLGLFRTTLRGVGPGGLPLAAPDKKKAPVTGVLHYTVDMQEFTDQLHPDLNPSTVWGYNPLVAVGDTSQAVHTAKYLGGVFIAHKDVPIQVTFRNQLPAQSIMPVDETIPGDAAPTAQNRTSVHLHGDFTPWISDGGPFAWFAPDGTHGPSFLNNQVLNPKAPAGSAEYYWPNQQSSRMMWYHDHALGITRSNAYAGLASVYLLRDDFEAGLVKNDGLPGFIENGGFELPLVIQDKIFVDAHTITQDPAWIDLGLPSNTGAFWYNHSYGPPRFNTASTDPPNPSVVAEFFGDTMLANGTVYPEVAVQPRRYRLRILNASNARFLNLQLYVDDGTADGITLDTNGNPTNAPGPDYLQIGTEGGLLPFPVVVPSNMPFDPMTLGGSLILAPAERADVIVDFSAFAGKDLILYNDAPGPFPGGDPLNDFLPGAVAAGSGPNTREIMRFSVGTHATLPPDPPLLLDPSTDLTAGNDPLLVPLGDTNPTFPPGTVFRVLTLNETVDEFDRLIQMLGTELPTTSPQPQPPPPPPLPVPPTSPFFGLPYESTPTETPKVGAIEVWQILNLTGDTHPIHFHLVNVQIISRQPFDAAGYTGGPPTLTGPAVPPDPNEQGWKDTVRMNPGEVTTVIMQFNLPKVPFTVPVSPRTGGFEYVWHCHILEHEEHDMMRPLVVR